MASFWKKLPKPFTVLAPMEDVTDYVFREIIAEIGKPDVLFTEFTNTDGLFSKGRGKTIRNFDYSEKQRPIVAQIWGNNPETFYHAAKLVRELAFDGIDINMGCPVKNVMKKKAGAGLIREQQLARELIAAVREGAGPLAVSVKTRIGINRIVTEEWVSFLLACRIDALTVHARTSDEESKVPAHWDELTKVVQLRDRLAPHTVIIGNGDVRDHGEALVKHQEYGVDGVMIGRGIFHNPWGLNKTEYRAEYSKEEKVRLFLKHVSLYEKKWGTAKNFQALKKFAKTYINGFDGANDMRQSLLASQNYADMKSKLMALAG